MGDVNIRIRDDNEDLDQRKEKHSKGHGHREQELLDVDMQKRRWKNRRRMAWISLVSMILVTLILLFAPIPDNRLKVISEPLAWSYFAFTSVIGAYMGFTAYASKGR